MDHIYRKEDAYFNRCCDVVVPTPIESFLNMKVRKVACGESHCLAVKILKNI
jgi:alpha-tubulin suppressor-like RCC1 family protein